MCYFHCSAKDRHRPGCIDILARLIIVVTVIMLAGAQAVWSQTCMNDNYHGAGGKGELNCSASEVYIAEDPNGNKIIDAFIVGDDGCAYPGDTATVDIVATIHFNASRFDVGIYTALDGGNALYGDCSVAPLPTTYPYPSPVIDLDGYPDICGDVLTGGSGADLPGFQFQRVSILCLDEDNDRQLDFSVCFSWRTSGTNETCEGANDLYPGNKSKCFCERVNIPVDVPPARIAVTKTATPASVYEPGGEVTFDVTVRNNSIDPLNDIIVNELVDDVYGDLCDLCGCSLPLTVAPGDLGEYTCSFTEWVSGNAGDSYTDNVFASGLDSRIPPNEMDGNSYATVTVLDVKPAISVVKTASPDEVPEPGADVTFTVVVTNESLSSSDPVTITSLTDDIHGNLTTLPGSSCSVPQTIPQGGGYTCSFTAAVTGNADYVETNTTTAAGADDEGTGASDSDDATVTVTNVVPAISVQKTASPTEVYEPGSDVTFTVVVTNESVSSSDPVTITSLTDDIHGDLTTLTGSTCSVPQTIPQGGSYTCSFTAAVTGNADYVETNTTTAAGADDEGTGASDSDDATVTVTNVVPAISVQKTASPTEVYEPGGDVTFNVVVTNESVSSSDPVTITSLTDDIHGDLTGLPGSTCSVPQTIPKGGNYSCSFTANVAGNEGDSETNTTTASGADDDGTGVSGSDDATVTVKGVAPAISVVKTASPTEVYEPGGDVTFTVVVTNESVSSSDPVTITSLTDDIHGDLTTLSDSTCSVPQTIPQGGGYTCSFTAAVTGNADYVETNTTTASGADDDGTGVSGSDDASVTVINVAPYISVVKAASPTEVPEPGADVTFTVVVTNDSVSSTDPVTITSLTDDIHGDLTGLPGSTCSVPQVIPQGGSYTCSFTAYVGGNVGDSETNTTTASGVDDEGTGASNSDDATVTFANVGPAASLTKTVTEILVTYTVTVTNDSAAEALVIDELSDDVYGNIADPLNPLIESTTCAVPYVLTPSGSPGDTYTCTFKALTDTSPITDIVTGTVNDDDGSSPVKPSDSATVTFE